MSWTNWNGQKTSDKGHDILQQGNKYSCSYTGFYELSGTDFWQEMCMGDCIGVDQTIVRTSWRKRSC